MIDSFIEGFFNDIQRKEIEPSVDFMHYVPVVREDMNFLVDRNERFNALIASRLRMGMELHNLSEATFFRALDKVTDFIYAMEGSFDLEEEKIEYETIIEDSVVVKFCNHPKMRLNIYYDEESIGEGNPEESYLLYEKQGRMTLVNDTIRNNVALIKEILAL